MNSHTHTQTHHPNIGAHDDDDEDALDVAAMAGAARKVQNGQVQLLEIQLATQFAMKKDSIPDF